MLRIWNCCARSWFSSVFTLTTLTLPACSSASCSSTGPERATGTAPGRPEVDQHGLRGGGVDHFGGKGGRGDGGVRLSSWPRLLGRGEPQFNRISAMTNFPTLERPDVDRARRSIRNISPKNSHWCASSPTRRDCRTPAARNAGARALALVQAVRAARGSGGALDAFLREYSLASREGVILMCLAEALLRIPDGETADRLIADKIPSGAWDEHLGDSDSLLVNASTWGLMLTGRVVSLDRNEVGEARSWYARLVGEAGRAGGARRAQAGDAHSRTPVRHGPRHRKRADARRRQGRARLSLFLRHAGRGRADARRRRALSREVFRGHRGRGPRRRDARIHHRAAQHLDQVVGAASALRVRADARACMRELYPVIEQLVRRGARRRASA